MEKIKDDALLGEIEYIVLNHYHSESEECAKEIASLIHRRELLARIEELENTIIVKNVDYSETLRINRLKQLQSQLPQEKP